MATFPLPPCQPQELKRRLYDEFKIEIPIITWQRRAFVRVSIQAYNSLEEIEALVAALAYLL
jgi:isopenicillin-N epimerase